jgi:hypothetical protein
MNVNTCLVVQDQRSGRTPLMFAVETKDLQLVSLFINSVEVDQARKLINMQNKAGNSAVHLAAGLRVENDFVKGQMLRMLIMSGGTYEHVGLLLLLQGPCGLGRSLKVWEKWLTFFQSVKVCENLNKVFKFGKVWEFFTTVQYFKNVKQSTIPPTHPPSPIKNKKKKNAKQSKDITFVC